MGTTSWPTRVRGAAALAVLIAMTACGGGGGGSSGSGSVTPTPPATPDPNWPAPGAFGSVNLERMAALAEIAANVQYFHPSDGVAETDWDAFLQYAMLRASQVGSDAEFVTLLRSLFAPMSPGVRFNEDSASFTVPADATLYAWEQNGYVEAVDRGSSNVYQRQRSQISLKALGGEGMPDEPASRYRVGGIAVLQPLVQVLNGGRTVPASLPFKPSGTWSPAQDFNKPAACLGAMAKAWGAIQNFYPYKQTLQLDWPAELRPLLASCDPSKGADLVPAVNEQLRRSLAKLNDNHLTLSAISLERRRWFLPFKVQLVEGRPLLVEPSTKLTELKAFDEVLSIDGKTPQALTTPLLPLSLANAHSRQEWTMYSDLAFTAQPQSYAVTVRRADGSQATVTVPTIDRWANDAPVDRWMAWHDMTPKLPLLQAQPDGLLYLNVSKLTQDELPRVLSALGEAKGVVLDLRSYPVEFMAWFRLFGYFVDRPIDALPLYDHAPYAPGPKVHRLRIPQQIKPALPRIKLPMLAIYSRYSQSQNEHALGFLQSAGVPLMGEPSSGANGNITAMNLLPDAEGKNALARITFTGMEVTQHDGSRFHDVGIQPDIRQGRTVAGLREGRDEVLEAALAWLRAKR